MTGLPAVVGLPTVIGLLVMTDLPMIGLPAMIGLPVQLTSVSYLSVFYSAISVTINRHCTGRPDYSCSLLLTNSRCVSRTFYAAVQMHVQQISVNGILLLLYSINHNHNHNHGNVRI